MAVTEILGTDSLSSSRLTINDNFLSLEDEITDLKGYLDPTAATLNGVTISTTQLEIGGNAINETSATLNVPVTINQNITLGSSIVISGFSADPNQALTGGLTEFVYSTYFIDPTNSFSIGSSSTDGTQITLITVAEGDITGDIMGSTNNTITFNNAYETITLRSYNGAWYIIAKCITDNNYLGGAIGAGLTGGN